MPKISVVDDDPDLLAFFRDLADSGRFDLIGAYSNGLIRRFHRAKVEGAPCVTCWGTGKALREFLYVDDLAHACIFLMENYDREEPINIGSGEELSIRELAQLVGRTIGFEGKILWDSSKPDGTPRKRLDSSRLLNLGWRPSVDLKTGIRLAYEDFLRRHPALEHSPVLAY